MAFSEDSSYVSAADAGPQQCGTCSGRLPLLSLTVFQLWPEGGCLGSWRDYIHTSLWIPTIPEVIIFEYINSQTPNSWQKGP